MVEQNSGLPINIEDRQHRLTQLSDFYIDIATGEQLRPETLHYLQTGGNLRLSLQEITKLVDKTAYEQQLDAERSAYVNELFEKPIIKGRPAYRQVRDTLRSEYVEGVVSKTARIVDAHGPKESLALLQMPTLVENTSFIDGEKLSPEDFAANHLYVLIDEALQEHVARRSLIDAHQRKTNIARFFGNRAVRMAIAGGVFVATVTPELHVIPIGSQNIAHDITLALEVLSATVFGLEAPEEIRWRYLDIVHGRRTKKLHEQLAENKNLSDLALRAAYSSTRYGNAVDIGTVTDRSGTDDKKENLRRFNKLDEQFKHLNNDPGGKPYTGDQALGYAARLLIERTDQLASIITPSTDTSEQKKLYLLLVRDIMTEDVMRMEKGLSSSRLRQRVLRVAGIIPAVLFPAALSLAGEASSGGQDVIEAATIKDDKKDKS